MTIRNTSVCSSYPCLLSAMNDQEICSHMNLKGLDKWNILSSILPVSQIFYSKGYLLRHLLHHDKGLFLDIVGELKTSLSS